MTVYHCPREHYDGSRKRYDDRDHYDVDSD